MRTGWRCGLLGGADAAIELLTGPLQRLRGLLFRKPDATVRLLLPCRDVHTFGMAHALDIAFADAAGRVLESHRSVGPCRRLRCHRAAMVAERFASAAPWPEPGDVLEVAGPDAREAHRAGDGAKERRSAP